MLSMFKKDSKEKIKVEFSTLSNSEKEIVESAYRAYLNASEKKIWHDVTRGPIHLDPSLEEMNKNYKHIADGWAAFVSCINQKHGDQEPHTNEIKEAFETAYKISAENKSSLGDKIPDFDSLAEIEKTAWTAAAQSAYDANLVTCATAPSPK